MPDRPWISWKVEYKYHGDDGNRVFGGETRPTEWSLEHKMQLSGGEEVLLIPEAEREPLADLFRKKLCYEPGKRSSARETLDHGWFQT